MSDNSSFDSSEFFSFDGCGDLTDGGGGGNFNDPFLDDIFDLDTLDHENVAPGDLQSQENQDFQFDVPETVAPKDLMIHDNQAFDFEAMETDASEPQQAPSVEMNQAFENNDAIGPDTVLPSFEQATPTQENQAFNGNVFKNNDAMGPNTVMPSIEQAPAAPENHAFQNKDAMARQADAPKIQQASFIQEKQAFNGNVGAPHQQNFGGPQTFRNQQHYQQQFNGPQNSRPQPGGSQMSGPQKQHFGGGQMAGPQHQHFNGAQMQQQLHGAQMQQQFNGAQMEQQFNGAQLQQRVKQAHMKLQQVNRAQVPGSLQQFGRPQMAGPQQHHVVGRQMSSSQQNKAFQHGASMTPPPSTETSPVISNESIVQSIEVDPPKVRRVPAPICVELENNGVTHRYGATAFEAMLRKIMHAAAEKEVQTIMAELTRTATVPVMTGQAMNAPTSSTPAMPTSMVNARSASSASAPKNINPIGSVAQPVSMPQKRSIHELLGMPFVELTEDERNQVLAYTIQRKNLPPSPPVAMLRQVKQRINSLNKTDKEKTLSASPPVIDLTRVESGRVEKTKAPRAPAAKKAPRTPAAKKGPCATLASKEAVAASGAALQASRNASVHIQSPAAARAQALAYAQVQAQALAHTRAPLSNTQPTKASKNNYYRVPSTPANAYFPPGSDPMAFDNGNRDARAANMLEGGMSAETAMQYGAGRQSEALQRAATLDAAGRRR